MMKIQAYTTCTSSQNTRHQKLNSYLVMNMKVQICMNISKCMRCIKCKFFSTSVNFFIKLLMFEVCFLSRTGNVLPSRTPQLPFLRLKCNRRITQIYQTRSGLSDYCATAAGIHVNTHICVYRLQISIYFLIICHI